MRHVLVMMDAGPVLADAGWVDPGVLGTRNKESGKFAVIVRHVGITVGVGLQQSSLESHCPIPFTHVLPGSPRRGFGRAARV